MRFHIKIGEKFFTHGIILVVVVVVMTVVVARAVAAVELRQQ